MIAKFAKVVSALPSEYALEERQLFALPSCFHVPVAFWKSLGDASCFVIGAQYTLHVSRYCGYSMSVHLVYLVGYH